MNSNSLKKNFRHFTLTFLMLFTLVSVSRATGSATIVAPNGTSVCLAYSQMNLYTQATGLAGSQWLYHYVWYDVYGSILQTNSIGDSTYAVLNNYQDSIYCVVTDSAGISYRTPTIYVVAQYPGYFSTQDYYDTLYVGGSLTQNMPFTSSWSQNVYIYGPQSNYYSNFNSDGATFVNIIFNGVTTADAGTYQVTINNYGNLCAGIYGTQSNVHLTVLDTTHLCNYSVYDSIFPATCSISADGSVGLTVVNASGTVQYKKGINGSWQPNSYFYNLAVGVDTFYVKDTTGCVTADIVTIGNYGNHPTPAVNISASHTQLCGASQVDTFAASYSYGGQTPLFQWYKNGTAISGATSASYITTSVAVGDSFWLKMTSNQVCASQTVVYSNRLHITTGTAIPAVTVSGVSHLCNGSVADTFRATPINGGTAPTYQWYHSNVLVSGATSATYISSNFAGYDSVYVVMTSSLTCASPSTATSALFFIYNNGLATPSVSITASATQLCGAMADTFRATPVNGGTAPTYQWYKNGTTISGATGSTYVTTSLVGGDSIWVKLTSNVPCASTTTALSNHIKLTAITYAPTVTLTASNPQICGTSYVDTFRTTVVNGGTAPTYHWYYNGVTAWFYSSTYILTVHPGDSLQVTVTSSLACASPSAVTSNQVKITNGTITPSVAVTATATSFCSGTVAADTFRATPTNGGTAPTYQWYKNGAAISGATASSYITTSFASSDSIWVVMTSNAACASPTTATGNKIHLSITTSTALTAGSNSPVASGAAITLTATASGATSYSWTGPNGFTSTSQNPTIPNATTAMGGIYHAHAAINSSSCGANGLTTVVVNQPVCNITLTDSISPASCSIFANGSIKVFATGGTAPYQYKNGVNGSWQTSNIFSPLLPGVDTIYVKDTTCSKYIVATVASQGSTITPSVSITASASQLSCTNTTDTFRATQTNGGLSPSYQWYKGGIAISGATSATYIGSGFQNNDSINVKMTSSNACALPSYAFSNIIRLTVTGTAVVPSVTITSTSTQLCTNITADTFRATPVNGGTAPTYQWYHWNTLIPGATGSTYIATLSGSGWYTSDSITCIMTSSASCASPASVISHAIYVTWGNATPDVIFTQSSSHLCNANSTDTFRAQPTNGGSAPRYQWYKNGIAISGATAATYVGNGFSNYDSISVLMTSSLPCAYPATAYWGTTLSVGTLTPSVTATAFNANLCALNTGAADTFYTSAVNAGNAPSFQWYQNGAAISGATSQDYVSAALANSDSIWVVMTSNAACASPLTATSNHIHLYQTQVQVSMSITASQSQICGSTVDTFRATLVNGGASPQILWYKNGANIAGLRTSLVYVGTVLPGDTVYAYLTSSLTCPNTGAARSNMIILTTPSPAVSVSAFALNLCTLPQSNGATDTFHATPTNGGSSPSYQWYKNGVAQGSNYNQFSPYPLAAGDSIWVVMTSNASCVSPTTATSAHLHVYSTPVTPSVAITATRTQVCGTMTDTFYVYSSVNGGVYPNYQWYKNGVAISGATASDYVASVSNGDSVWVVMTSTLNCTSPASIASSHIHISTGTVAPSVSITGPLVLSCNYYLDTFYTHPVNGGTAPTYVWYKNGVALAVSNPNNQLWNTPIANGDSIWVVMTSSLSCASPTTATSAHFYINNSTFTPSVSVTATATNFCSGAISVDTFRATPTNGGTAPTYQWYKNGIAVSGATSATYFTTALANGDSIWVVMTSSLTCVSPTTATSGKLHLTISSAITATVTSNSPVSLGGTINLTCATVSGALSYSWTGPSGFTSSSQNPSRTGATAAMGGVYSVHVTNTSTCGANGSVNVVIGTTTCNMTLTDSITAPVCTYNSGVVKVFATNGTAPYQYKNGVNGSYQTSNTFSSIAAGTDTFYVLDNTGCTKSMVVTIVRSGSYATLSPTSNSPVALGGTISLTANPSGTLSTYSWTGPNGFTSSTQNPTITGATAAMGGTYHVTAANTVGCNSNGLVTVTISTSVAGANQTVGCAILPGGSATMAAGGTGTWTTVTGNPGTATITTPTSASTTITGFTATGVYSFKWTTSGGTSGIATVTVTAKPNAGTDQTVVLTSLPGGTATMAASGTGTWTARSGNPGTATIVSPSSPTTTITTFSAAGTYYFIYANSTGCTDTAVVQVTLNSGCHITLRDSITPVGCQVNSGVVKVYASGGTSPYQYRNGINGTWQTGSIFTGQYPGVDTIYVKDTLGCSAYIFATITRPTNLGYPTATASSNSPVNVGGTLNLTASFTGAVNIANGSLLWTGPNSFSSYVQNPSISPATTAAAGVYHLLVYDDSTSCTARALTTVVINTSACNISLRDSVTPAGCAYNSGIVTLYAAGGTAPYKYKNGIGGTWQSSNVFSGLTAGTDTFYVKDTITCSQSVVVQIIRTGTYPTTAPTSNTPVAPGGTINLLANAPSATGYTWSGPNGYTSTAQNPSLTPATVAMTGTYYLTVTNVSGCNAIGSTTVFVGSSNCNITLSDSVKNNSCFASRDGRVIIYPSGGSAPYQYRNGTSGTWQSSNVFSNLSIGTFTFYVKDTNNCSATISASITEPSYISNTLQINDASGTANNGSLLVFSRGGVGNSYTYHWSTGATGYSITGLAPGLYCVTATDQTGCTSSICDSIIRTTTSTTAPLILYLDTVTGASGQTATVHVRVKNFKHITTAQATIQFDASVATYSTVSQFAISSLSAANIGANAASSGILNFSWFDPTLAGVTLTDGTVLFAITYNLVGTGGQYTPIVLTDSPTVREFDDTSLAPIPYYTYPGGIHVTSNINISGRIHSWAVNSGVRGTTVALYGNPSNNVVTDSSGNYSFSVVQGSTDTVTPSKNNDSTRANGVTTLDVLTVQHYILGTATISGPYGLIAADVNGSGTITTSDYAQIQALLLGNITTFTGNKLWAFVPSNYSFANPQAPWGFPTSRYYTSATTQSNELAQDFVGIKLGDVTGDWNPALARTQGTTDSVLLYTSDRTVSVNDTNILIPVRCRNCNALSGFQYSVQWDSSALSFAGISDVGYASGVSYGSNQSSSGLLAISWIAQTANALYVPDDSILFYLRFSAIGARGDSSYVAINSAQIPVEMIDSTLNLLPTSVMNGKVKIAYATGITPVTADDMISIHPNPSSSRVIVEVSAPGSEILITDISGKEVYSTTTIGTNASISTQNWAAGIYTVSVKLADVTKNIKLVVMH